MAASETVWFTRTDKSLRWDTLPEMSQVEFLISSRALPSPSL